MNRVACPVLLALLARAIAVRTRCRGRRARRPRRPRPQSAANALPRVIVTGTRENEDNYRVPTLDSLGPLGATPIIDLPYSIAVLPQDLIENSQAVNFKDVSKYLPLVAYQEQQGPDILRPQTRGMQGGNFQNTKLDGMTMFITVATAHGAVPADRGGQRSVGLPVRTGQSLRHVQLRLQASDRLRPARASRESTTATASVP